MTDYLSKIWRLRHFWLALVRIDLQRRYRRSVIGIGWSLLHPIAMTAVLTFVFSQMFKTDPARLLSGLTFWGFITAAVMQGCHSFFQGESYIRQHPAPLAIYPLRTVLGAGFHFLLGFVVVLVFVWGVRGFSNLPALVCVVPAFAVLFVVGWSLAICMGISNVLFQDSQHLIEVAMQIMFYMTPIIYPPSMLVDKGYGWVVHWNPFAMLLELIQQPVLYGQFPSQWAMAVGAGTALLAAAVATLALRCFEKRMIFYL